MNLSMFPILNLQNRTLEYIYIHYFRCLYTVRNVIKIYLKIADGLEITEDANIIKIFELFTFSSVMFIWMAYFTLKLEGNMILKFFN